MSSSLDEGLDVFPDEVTLTTLPPRLRELQLTVRAFAEDVVRPRVLALDQAPAEHFDWEMVQLGHELGLTRLTLPVEHGGGGYGILGWPWRWRNWPRSAPGPRSSSVPPCSARPGAAVGRPGAAGQVPARFSAEKAVLACNAITEDLAGCDLLIPENAEHAVG